MHNHFKTYLSHSEKTVLYTTLRCGSSACEQYLTPDKGWEMHHGANVFHDVPRIQGYARDGYKFYVLLKNPWLKMCSAFDMVIPGFDHNDVKVSTEVFIQVLRERVHRNAERDIKKYGYANYVLEDAHLAWGNHVMMLFMESLDIPVEPLIMDTLFADMNKTLGYQTFNNYLKTLNDPEISAFVSDIEANRTFNIDNVENNEGYHNLNMNFRFERCHAYINHCSQFVNEGGGREALVPKFTVFDWMDCDNKMYNACLQIRMFDPLHQSDKRKEFANSTLESIIQNINSKTNLHDIILDKRVGGECFNSTHPCDSVLGLLDIFWDHQHLLPELYDFPRLSHLGTKRDMRKYVNIPGG